VGDGDFHHDDTVFVTHAAERCESRQVFKKVLKNGAVGVFQGKILVKQARRRPTATRSASRCCWTRTASSSPSPSWRSTPMT
jgi:Fe-S cluster assembly scaffold protein SufB